MEDQELVKGCIDGDRNSQELLYKRFSKKMFGVCLGYAKSHESAKDFLQESFIKIFNNIHKYDFQGSLEGWVRRVVVNTAIDHYRKEIRNAAKDKQSEISLYAEKQYYNRALTKLDSEDFLKLLHALPNGYRTILNLYVVEEYSHKEIADMLGITEGTSKSQFFKAKAYLLRKAEGNTEIKKLLQEYYYGN